MSGGRSGPGSVGRHRDWKWGVIGRYVPDIYVVSVIDVGCGDLSFWEGRDCAKYLGIDWSEFIIAQNQASRVGWDFLILPAEQYVPNIKATVVFCFDLLIHIEKGASFRKILENLCQYSKDLIFVFGWEDSRGDNGKTCFYHSIEKHMNVFQLAGFRLLATYKFNPQLSGVIYVFRKEVE